MPFAAQRSARRSPSRPHPTDPRTPRPRPGKPTSMLSRAQSYPGCSPLGAGLRLRVAMRARPQVAGARCSRPRPLHAHRRRPPPAQSARIRFPSPRPVVLPRLYRHSRALRNRCPRCSRPTSSASSRAGISGPPTSVDAAGSSRDCSRSRVTVARGRSSSAPPRNGALHGSRPPRTRASHPELPPGGEIRSTGTSRHSRRAAKSASAAAPEGCPRPGNESRCESSPSPHSHVAPHGPGPLGDYYRGPLKPS